MADVDDKGIFVQDIVDRQEIAACFLIEDLRLGQTKNGKAYAALRLKDRTGRIEARVWNGAQEFSEIFADGDLIRVIGVSESFQGQVQVRIDEAKKADINSLDLAFFLPASPFDPEEMFLELLDIIRGIKNPHLRGLLEDIFGDEKLAGRFKKAPAAKRFHHAYISGLLEHSLSVARAVLAVAPLYPALDRDLLITGALIHDLGKTEEFDSGLSGDYTTDGRLLGHMILGLEILEARLAARPDFPVELGRLLKHLIISHHGDYQFGSPKRPKILEALALNYLDELDAKLNGIGGFIERHADAATGWTDYNRLMERFFLKRVIPGYDDVEPGGAFNEDELVPDRVEAEPEAVREVRAAGASGEGEEDNEATDQLSLLDR